MLEVRVENITLFGGGRNPVRAPRPKYFQNFKPQSRPMLKIHCRPHCVIGFHSKDNNRNDTTSDMDTLDTRVPFDPLSDLEERRVIFAALDSFQ
jgi:hypothetical protein